MSRVHDQQIQYIEKFIVLDKPQWWGDLQVLVSCDAYSRQHLLKKGCMYIFL